MKNPNGYGSVYKLSGNRRKPWAVRVTTGWKDGKQLYKMLGYYKTRPEAVLALAEYNRNPYDIDLQALTFAEVYEMWSKDHFKKVSKSRISTYRTVFKQSNELHNIPFKDIKLRHLQAQINNKSNLSRMTLRHHKNVYRQLFSYAMKHDFAEKNYAEYIELPQYDTEREELHYNFTPTEINTLFNRSTEKDIDIILMLIYTGTRIMELLEIKTCNVNLKERYMIGGNKSIAGKNRIIPIHDKIFPFIENRMQQDNEYLIKPPRAKKYVYSNFRQKVWLPLMQNLSMEHTMHDTRHTCISMLDKAGINKITIQRIVGHSNKDVTEKYTHKDIPELLEAINRI